MHDVLSIRAQFADAITNCLAVLSRGPKDFAQWQCDARAAVQRLYDLKESSQRGGSDLGLSLPAEEMMQLIGFINVNLQRAYLWNEISSITALPAPASWQRQLRDFAETLGAPKARRAAPAMTEEDKAILETLADEYPMAVTAIDLAGALNCPREKVGERLAWLESKRLVKRPDGTRRKGHAITPAGLTAIGRPVEPAH